MSTQPRTEPGEAPPSPQRATAPVGCRSRSKYQKVFRNNQYDSKTACGVAQETQQLGVFDAIVASVSPQRFAQLILNGKLAIVPICADPRCGQALDDPAMALWASLEARDPGSYACTRFELRAFHKEHDVFGAARRSHIDSCWWGFGQLWSCDQRGVLG